MLLLDRGGHLYIDKARPCDPAWNVLSGGNITTDSKGTSDSACPAPSSMSTAPPRRDLLEPASWARTSLWRSAIPMAERFT